MNFRFNFRGENNKFVNDSDWSKVKKVDFVSSEIDKKVVNNINSWINHDFAIKTSDKISWIKDVLNKMSADKRSNNFAEKFLKSYINSSAPLKKINPLKVYNVMIANGIEQYWK